MKRQDLISMTDEYVFRSTLAKAKISDDEKISIIKDRNKYLFDNKIQKKTTSIPIGPYTDPLTGLPRFNTGS